MAMQLVIGLGNPGLRYAATRHNIGFRCVEELGRRLGLTFQDLAPEYRVATGSGPGGALVLMEPLTYMNRSGQALGAWAARAGLPLTAADDPGAVSGPVPVVICDDLHLPLGSIRIRAGGSDGGQNGLASILDLLGTREVPRVRLGVGPLDEQALDPATWADYVLEPFPATAAEAVNDLIDRGTVAVLDLLEHGPVAAASRHNRRVRPVSDLPSGD